MENIENLNDEGQENVVDSQEEQAETPKESVEEVEVAEQPKEEKPVQDEETNAKFAEVRRKAETEAKDKVIAEMYGESHGIYSYSDYQKALDQQKEQEELTELTKKDIPEEVAKELMEARKLKEEVQRERKEKEQQEKTQKDISAFKEYYQKVNGKPYNEETLPDEVWEAVKQGTPLKYAYMEYRSVNVEQGQKTQQQNQENAEVSTGSVKGKLDISSDNITFEEFEANKHDQKWVMKNYNKIQKSRAKW